MQYKIKDQRPQPNDEEREICETFAKAKWAGAQAETLKDQVQAIVEKYGEVTTQSGMLIASASTRYPVPTKAEWKARVDALRNAAVEDGEMAERRAAELAMIDGDGTTPGLTDRLNSYWEVCEWQKEMEDYLKAAGVTPKKSTPTVKYLQFKTRPDLPAVPGEKKKKTAATSN